MRANFGDIRSQQHVNANDVRQQLARYVRRHRFYIEKYAQVRQQPAQTNHRRARSQRDECSSSSSKPLTTTSQISHDRRSPPASDAGSTRTTERQAPSRVVFSGPVVATADHEVQHSGSNIRYSRLAADERDRHHRHDREHWLDGADHARAARQLARKTPWQQSRGAASKMWRSTWRYHGTAIEAAVLLA